MFILLRLLTILYNTLMDSRWCLPLQVPRITTVQPRERRLPPPRLTIISSTREEWRWRSLFTVECPIERHKEWRKTKTYWRTIPFIACKTSLFMSFVHGPNKGHLQPHVYIFIHQTVHFLPVFFLFLCSQRHFCKLFLAAEASEVYTVHEYYATDNDIHTTKLYKLKSYKLF